MVAGDNHGCRSILFCFLVYRWKILEHISKLMKMDEEFDVVLREAVRGRVQSTGVVEALQWKENWDCGYNSQESHRHSGGKMRTFLSSH